MDNKKTVNDKLWQQVFIHTYMLGADQIIAAMAGFEMLPCGSMVTSRCYCVRQLTPHWAGGPPGLRPTPRARHPEVCWPSPNHADTTVQTRNQG